MLPGQFIGSNNFGDVIERSFHGLPTLKPVHNCNLPECGVDQLSTDMVYIRNDNPARPTLVPLYSGPYVVAGQHKSYFDVQVGDRVERVNIHHLKPARTTSDVQPAVPPKYGQLRKNKCT